MGLGIIGGAMSGAGAAGQALALKGADYLERSTLQQEMAEIQKLRDERLAEMRKEELRYAEDLRREPGKKAQAEIEQKRSEYVDDLSGTVRQRSPSEMASVEEDAYRKHGMTAEALQARQIEQQRQRDVEASVDRREGHQVQRESIAAQREYHGALIAVHQAAEGRLTNTAKIDDAIKKIAFDNAKRVEGLRDEFAKANPDRKAAIKEEIQLLTGKDNDNYLPVPEGFDPVTGKPTSYRIFDKKAGKWMDEGRPGAQPTQAHIDALRSRASDPAAVAAFEAQFGKGAASQYLPKPATPKHAQPAASAPAQAEEPERPAYEKYIVQRRGGVYIDAPARSRFASMNGRTFGSREDALRELGALDAYQNE